tara:strand:+ start:135 stop:320 length:186 start_codon:yes stop_codon:yes gene_type:complete
VGIIRPKPKTNPATRRVFLFDISVNTRNMGNAVMMPRHFGSLKPWLKHGGRKGKNSAKKTR